MLHSVVKQLPAWPEFISPGAPGVICVKINYYFILICYEYQPKDSDALRLWSKGGMVHVWVAGKTV